MNKITTEQFEQTFEHSGIGMALVGLDGKWVRVNNQLCNLLGYTSDDLIKLTFQDITHPDDLEKDLTLLNKVIAGEINSYEIDKRYYHKNRSIIWAQLNVALIRDLSDEPLHFVSQIFDVTELKTYQNKIESLHKKTKTQNKQLINYTNIVSHNLRTHSENINSIIGFLEDELNSTLSGNETFSYLKAASNSLRETLMHLDEIAKVKAKSQVPLSKLNLYKFINKAITDVNHLKTKAKGRIINRVDPSVTILGIPAFIDSICLNFITNAIKYRCNSRPLELEIYAKQEHSFTHIYFKDNGKGVDLNLFGDDMFTLYKTFHNHSDSKGVGLFLTKTQAEALGGYVDVESTPKTGSTFKIALQTA